jgi:cobalt-zinc-cadmium efflux system membrane fusion protein
MCTPGVLFFRNGVFMSEDHARNRHALPVHRQILIVIVVSVALFGGFGLWFLSAAPATPANMPRLVDAKTAPASFMPTQEQLASLTIVPVSMMTFRSETVTDGSIALDEDLATPVFSPFSGRVMRVMAKLGNRVTKGTPLLEIEASEFSQAQSDLITAKAQYDLAATNEKRQHDLYDSQGAALKDWQQVQVALKSAEASLAGVRNRLRILGKTDAEIDALERMAQAPAMNDVSAVLAPIPGTIVQRKVGLGQYVQAASADPVFMIGDLTTVWLVANVRETDAPMVHTGDPVEVHVLAYPGHVFDALISYVAPSINPATHRLAVRADVANPEGLLKPQMFANFTIVTGGDTRAVGVPQSAVMYEGDNARVWVNSSVGALALRQIRTGRSNGGMVEVLGGLDPGERVVVRGAVFIDRAATSP